MHHTSDTGLEMFLAEADLLKAPLLDNLARRCNAEAINTESFRITRHPSADRQTRRHELKAYKATFDRITKDTATTTTETFMLKSERSHDPTTVQFNNTYTVNKLLTQLDHAPRTEFAYTYGPHSILLEYIDRPTCERITAALTTHRIDHLTEQLNLNQDYDDWNEWRTDLDRYRSYIKGVRNGTIDDHKLTTLDDTIIALNKAQAHAIAGFDVTLTKHQHELEDLTRGSAVPNYFRDGPERFFNDKIDTYITTILDYIDGNDHQYTTLTNALQPTMTNNLARHLHTSIMGTTGVVKPMVCHGDPKNIFLPHNWNERPWRSITDNAIIYDNNPRQIHHAFDLVNIRHQVSYPRDLNALASPYNPTRFYREQLHAWGGDNTITADPYADAYSMFLMGLRGIAFPDLENTTHERRRYVDILGQSIGRLARLHPTDHDVIPALGTIIDELLDPLIDHTGYSKPV
jgi:hypothetical protein